MLPAERACPGSAGVPVHSTRPALRAQDWKSTATTQTNGGTGCQHTLPYGYERFIHTNVTFSSLFGFSNLPVGVSWWDWDKLFHLYDTN